MRYRGAVLCTCAAESRMFASGVKKNPPKPRPWKEFKHDPLLLAVNEEPAAGVTLREIIGRNSRVSTLHPYPLILWIKVHIPSEVTGIVLLPAGHDFNGTLRLPPCPAAFDLATVRMGTIQQHCLKTERSAAMRL